LEDVEAGDEIIGNIMKEMITFKIFIDL